MEDFDGITDGDNEGGAVILWVMAFAFVGWCAMVYAIWEAFA